MPEGTDNIAGLNASLPTDDAPAGEGAAEIRQLKAVLKNCLGAVDGAIYDADGTKPSAADFSRLFSVIDGLLTDDGGGGDMLTVPFVGMIVPYYGDGTTIPSGWVFCDGRNGTPDLTGRFPIGWQGGFGLPKYLGASSGGALPSSWTTSSSGAHTHTLSVQDHTITTANLPAHDHELFRNESNAAATAITTDEAAAYIGGGSGGPDYTVRPAPTNPTTTSPNVGRSGTGGLSTTPTALSHTGSTASNGSHTHTLDGADLPPWSAVYWIMYVGADGAPWA